jgi:hypothetical protein
LWQTIAVDDYKRLVISCSKNKNSMEVKFEASKEELAELAKMAYVARFVFDSSGVFSTGYKYPNKDIFNLALRTFNKMILAYIPNSDYVEIDELDEELFINTMTIHEECEAVIDQYNEECFLEKVCLQLTNRDYTEQYGRTLNLQALLTSDVYHILYNSNEEELLQHGLKRLRISE